MDSMELLRESVLHQLLPDKEYDAPDDEISFGGSVNLSIGGFEKGDDSILPPVSPIRSSASKSLVSQSCEYSNFDHELGRSVKLYAGSRRVDISPSPLLQRTFAFDGGKRLGSPKAQIRKAMQSRMKRRSPSRRARRKPKVQSEDGEQNVSGAQGAPSASMESVFTFEDVQEGSDTYDELFVELERISCESISRVRKMYKDIIIDK